MPESLLAGPSPKRRSLPVPLLLVLVLILILAFLVFRYFLLTFTVAAALSVFYAPLQRRLTRGLGGRSGLAAGLLVVATTLVILVPILASATILSRQALTAFEEIRPRLQPAALREFLLDTLPARYPTIRDWVDFQGDELPRLASDILSGVAATANGLIQGTVARLTSTFLDLLLFLMMLFFLLRDGGRLRAELRGVSPFSERQENDALDHMGRTVKGVLQAMVVVPVVQGLVAVIGFLIFGVPVPLLWGLIVVLAALIPLLGSPLGWVPACLYLLVHGATWQWVGMSLYGVLCISSIDNLVKPMLLRDAAQIHPLLGFFSILGGLLAFGPLGFLVGPVILSLVLSALRIYRLDVLRENPELFIASEPSRSATGT
jgi:predicted PurR-regulated permease PerM